MPRTQPAPAVDRRAPERFLCATERRALQMAMLAVADREAALGAVEETFHDFAARCAAHVDTDWPVLFWRLLDDRLSALRGAAQPRRSWFGARAGALDANERPVNATEPAARDGFMALADHAALGALIVALQALPTPACHAFLLRVRENLDVPTTATILRLSDTAVRTHLYQALQQLRTGLRTTRSGPATQTAAVDGAWILRCRALLDRAAQDLDDATVSRLALARHAALAPAAVHPRARNSGAGRWLVWVGGLAIAAGVALALTRFLPAPDETAAPISAPREAAAPPPPRIAPSEDTPLAAPDFDLLLDADDEALLDELEFHAWLAADALRDE